MAIKFVNKKKPDLILLDLMMPGMNGKVNDESTAFHAITPLVLASLYDTTFCRSLLLFFAPVGCDACSIFPAGKVPSCCDCCWFAAVNFTESGKYLMFVGQEIIDSNIIPIVIPTVESNELNGKAIMKISTRSGPSIPWFRLLRERPGASTPLMASKP